MLNPALDVAALARRFAVRGRLQVAEFLLPATAATLAAELAADGRWQHVINGGGKVFEVPAATLDRMAADERAKIDRAVLASATEGFQFRYDTIRVGDGPRGWDAAGGALGAFARTMNRPEVLAVLGRIAGLPSPRFADAQATRYRAGDFLTRHDDDVAGKHRALAYVLGLTDGWRPEWGGLLLFDEMDDIPAEVFVPRFNTLSLFTVPQPHSVSYVAPFACQARLAVTGWLRREAPEGA